MDIDPYTDKAVYISADYWRWLHPSSSHWFFGYMSADDKNLLYKMWMLFLALLLVVLAVIAGPDLKAGEFGVIDQTPRIVDALETGNTNPLIT